MINILIPSMGKSLFFKDSYFPKPMIEIAGKTMLEHVVENYRDVPARRFIFVFSHEDSAEFHLDASARILAGAEAEILILGNRTAGALCTCLMAVGSINNDTPLWISNCDQIIDVDYNDVIGKFEGEGASAGVITFDSIHPRWSYARVKDSEVVEVAEKRPLSKHAIAGAYYFRHGREFIEAAEKAILKDTQVNGQFYISASINEVILSGGKVSFYHIPRERYHSFYSPEKIQDYEKGMEQ